MSKFQKLKSLPKNDHVGVTKYEATSKGYFAPADRDPDHVQRIQNGDSSTEVEILYADGRLNFIACESLIE